MDPPSLLPPESRDLRVLDLTRQVQILLRFDSRTQSIWDLIFKSRSLWKVISNQKVLPKSHKFQPFNRIATHWCALGWSLRSQPLKILNIFPKTPKPDSIDVQVNTSPLSPNSLTHLFFAEHPFGGTAPLIGGPSSAPCMPAAAIRMSSAHLWGLPLRHICLRVGLEFGFGFGLECIKFKHRICIRLWFDKKCWTWPIDHPAAAMGDPALHMVPPTCFLLGQRSGTILPVSYFSC